MRGILYYRPENPSGEQLLTLLKPIFTDHILSCHRTVEHLSRDLKQSANDQGIAILCLDTYKDLSAMLEIRDLFWKHRIVLILPDMERETVARAVQLFPRYMTAPDQGLNDIKDVVSRLMEQRGDSSPKH
ncbi:MAG: hypothetical protein V1793_10150 [Pseudomonadota bacterium]